MRARKTSWILPLAVFAVTILAGAPLRASLGVSVIPARVTDTTPFEVVIALNGSCPQATKVERLPGYPRPLHIAISDLCLSPPADILLSIPIEPLLSGDWVIRVQYGNDETDVPLKVEPAPFSIDTDPAAARIGDGVSAVVRGSDACPHFAGPPDAEGRLISLHYSGRCAILPPGPSPFELHADVGSLDPGDHVVQIVDDGGSILASHRFRVRAAGSCVPSDTILCLRDNRFQVEATWSTATASGQAQVVPQTDDSGAFWFFSQGNLELLVKVLNACGAKSPRFWVFASGLTNVGVHLTVTDTQSGETWERDNPLGQRFPPLFDTNAFASCP